MHACEPRGEWPRHDRGEFRIFKERWEREEMRQRDCQARLAFRFPERPLERRAVEHLRSSDQSVPGHEAVTIASVITMRRDGGDRERRQRVVRYLTEPARPVC